MRQSPDLTDKILASAEELHWRLERVKLQMLPKEQRLCRHPLFVRCTDQWIRGVCKACYELPVEDFARRDCGDCGTWKALPATERCIECYFSRRTVL